MINSDLGKKYIPRNRANYFYNFIERFLLKDKDINWLLNLRENEVDSSKREFLRSLRFSTICFGLGVIDPKRPMALS